MWDRFDDAMDSTEDEQRQLLERCADLEAQLAARGVKTEPWQPPRARESLDLNDRYHDARSSLESLRSHIAALRQRLEGL